jgi:hypothetical protein
MDIVIPPPCKDTPLDFLLSFLEVVDLALAGLLDRFDDEEEGGKREDGE